ncbi:MAG: DUF642 domain-containing protein [Alphaproteobacteria bacterium]|nr:DUF642 domain-containing protein [Alphaproteobacteria bacterium]
MAARIIPLALALSASLATIPANARPLVTNGSFEQPVVPDGTYQLFNTGDSFKGWTVIGDTGNVAIVSGDFSYCVPLPAKKGKQFLDLTGTSDTATGVQTSINTQPGATYRITFFVGNIVGSGNCGTTTTVNLLIDGVPAGSFTNRRGGDTLNWKKFSTEFTAQNATTTIAFVNGDPPDDTGDGLDAVSVRLVTAP